jgi:DNA end-binding protein Ku
MGATKTSSAATPTPKAWANLSLQFGSFTAVKVGLEALASAKTRVSAKTCCPDHRQPLPQRYLCGEGTDHEHLLAKADTLMLYPHPDDKDTLVEVNDGILEGIVEERTGEITVGKIVDSDTIDPLFYDQTYLCWAQTGDFNERLLAIFAEALKATGKAAVATGVLSKNTVLLVIRWSPELDTLVVHTCQFAERIKWHDVSLVKARRAELPEPSTAELEMAISLFDTLAGEFDASEVEDTYGGALLDAIRASAGGSKVAKTTRKTAAAKPTEDLLAALKASVDAAKTTGDEKPKRTPRKKAAA